jgi:hypothetical protein
VAGRRIARVVGAAALISTVCVALPRPAGAATVWQRRIGPSPSSTYNELTGVSCVSELQCTGVGFYESGERILSLIVQTTNGKTWTQVASPSYGKLTELMGVSCTSVTDCVAVGAFQSTGVDGVPKYVTLVVRTTDGTSWNEVASPRRNQSSALWGISCTSAIRCRAVGGFAGKALVLRTSNGTTWFRQPVPTREGGANFLSSIDCVSNTNCTAVGSFQNFAVEGSRSRTLVLHTTNGHTWLLVNSPNPSPRNSDASLDDVSCVGATTCTAVGWLSPIPGGVTRGFIVRTTNGTTWTRSATPARGGEVDLDGIECLSATVCTAVGFAWDAAHEIFNGAILQTTNGTTWRAPNPASDVTGQALDDVTCPTANHCFGVGTWNFTGSIENPLRSLVLQEK